MKTSKFYGRLTKADADYIQGQVELLIEQCLERESKRWSGSNPPDHVTVTFKRQSMEGTTE